MNFGKIQEEGQSAGNFVGGHEASCEAAHKGSSETTREVIKLDEKFK
jgi:hypothetical protein